MLATSSTASELTLQIMLGALNSNEKRIVIWSSGLVVMISVSQLQCQP